MKAWRVLRDLSLGFLTFILDDTGVWVEYRDTNSERNFWEYPKNNKPHIFTPPRPLGSGGVKIWGLLFFFKKYKIGNNDFTTILGSVNVKNMTPTTICSSNPTENVLGGSIDHTESSWTLNNTPILLTSGVDLIFGFQKQIYHISDIFKSGSLHDVARLGSEFIGLWFIFTKYINFLTRHTHHVWPSYPTISWVARSLIKRNWLY